MKLQKYTPSKSNLLQQCITESRRQCQLIHIKILVKFSWFNFFIRLYGVVNTIILPLYNPYLLVLLGLSLTTFANKEQIGEYLKKNKAIIFFVLEMLFYIILVITILYGLFFVAKILLIGLAYGMESQPPSPSKSKHDPVIEDVVIEYQPKSSADYNSTAQGRKFYEMMMKLDSEMMADDKIKALKMMKDRINKIKAMKVNEISAKRRLTKIWKALWVGTAERLDDDLAKAKAEYKNNKDPMKAKDLRERWGAAFKARFDFVHDEQNPPYYYKFKPEVELFVPEEVLVTNLKPDPEQDPVLDPDLEQEPEQEQASEQEPEQEQASEQDPEQKPDLEQEPESVPVPAPESDPEQDPEASYSYEARDSEFDQAE